MFSVSFRVFRGSKSVLMLQVNYGRHGKHGILERKTLTPDFRMTAKVD